MTQDEATAIAHAEAERRGWPWTEPVFVARERSWLLFGSVRWRFMTNAACRGANANIVVDDRTGQVVVSAFAPR